MGYCWRNWRVQKNTVVLFLIGIALSLIQFVMIRDFVAILGGEQLVIILVTTAFFAALSIGYFCSSRLSTKTFQSLFIITLFLQLSIPYSYRYLAAELSQVHANGYAYIALLFGYALIFSATFAVFLPRLIEAPHIDQTQADKVKNLRVYYSIELLGFIAGFVLIGLNWNKPLIYLLAIYWLVLTVLLNLAINRRILTIAYSCAVVIALYFLPVTDSGSNALLYEYKHGIKNPIILYSINTAYTKVEVVQGQNHNRHLYLNGLENLNATDLETLNYYIAELPARLIKPAKTLLVGNGTLSSVSKVYPYSGAVTSVELDSGVLQAGRAFFTPPENLQGLERWHLFIDDGKHFLAHSSDQYDLIIMDIPSPLTLQVAFLHTVEFYRLASDHLTENGVIAVQLSGKLQRNNRSPARITAALAQVFPEIMVVYSEKGSRGFAYASKHLPFDRHQLFTEAMTQEYALQLLEPKNIPAFLTHATALTINTLDLVTQRSFERLAERYFDD